MNTHCERRCGNEFVDKEMANFQTRPSDKSFIKRTKLFRVPTENRSSEQAKLQKKKSIGKKIRREADSACFQPMYTHWVSKFVNLFCKKKLQGEFLFMFVENLF